MVNLEQIFGENGYGNRINQRAIKLLEKNKHRINKPYMFWSWQAIGNYIPGKVQQKIKDFTGIKDNRYTYCGIGYNVLRNIAKFGIAYLIFTKTIDSDSSWIKFIGSASSGGLVAYGCVATAELTRRIYTVTKTRKPTAQITVELGYLGIKSFGKALDYLLHREKNEDSPHK